MGNGGAISLPPFPPFLPAIPALSPRHSRESGMRFRIYSFHWYNTDSWLMERPLP